LPVKRLSFSKYADGILGGEDQLLAELRRAAALDGLPSIQVPTDLGRLLTVLVMMLPARRVLEIGTLFGYSAILMARAMPQDGLLTTLEVDPKHAGIARANLEKASVADLVSVVEGPALHTLDGLRGEVFDLIFIDADKDSYPAYLERAIELSRPGTVIVADNVWRGGCVVAPAEGDSSNVGLAEFNKALGNDDRLVSTFIATRDGEDAASISVVR
jgi:predicted O-methyltransferase YrrM